jgi:hypothetical protein
MAPKVSVYVEDYDPSIILIIKIKSYGFVTSHKIKSSMFTLSDLKKLAKGVDAGVDYLTVRGKYYYIYSEVEEDPDGNDSETKIKIPKKYLMNELHNAVEYIEDEGLLDN